METPDLDQPDRHHGRSGSCRGSLPSSASGRSGSCSSCRRCDALVLKDARRATAISSLAQTSPGILTLSDVTVLSRRGRIPISSWSPSAEPCAWSGRRPLLGGRGDLPTCSSSSDWIRSSACSSPSTAAPSWRFSRARRILAATLTPDAGRGLLRSPGHAERLPGGLRSAHGDGPVQRRLSEARQAGSTSRRAEELFLATFVSNEPFNEKLILLDRAILLLFVAGALLTVLLGLFFSRNITHPIGELLGAMGRIRDGVLDTQVRTRGGTRSAVFSMGSTTWRASSRRAERPCTTPCTRRVLLKEYNEKIVNSIRAGIAIVNSDLVVEKANSSFLSTFGLDAARAMGAPLTYLDIDIIDEMIVEKILAIFRRESRVPFTGVPLACGQGLRDSAVPVLQRRGRVPRGLGLRVHGRRHQRPHRAGGEDLPGREAVHHQHALRRNGARNQQPAGVHPHQRAEPDRRGVEPRAARIAEMDRAGDATDRDDRAGAAELRLRRFRARAGIRRERRRAGRGGAHRPFVGPGGAGFESMRGWPRGFRLPS